MIVRIKHLLSTKFLLLVLVIVNFFLVAAFIINIRNSQFRPYPFNNPSNVQPNKLDKLISRHEQVAFIREVVNDSLKEMLLFHNHLSSTPFSASLKSTNPFNEGGSQTDPYKVQRMFHHVSDLNKNHSIRNAQLKPFEVQITIEERQMMYTLLEVFDKVMKKENITYFMYGGTLLGSYRHHDLIPWDDDIDVIVSVKYYNNMENVFKSLLPDFILYQASKHNKFYHKSAKKTSKFNWCWPYVDISYYDENETFIEDWTKTYGRWYYYPKEIIFPLHNRPLLTLTLPAPKDTFAFLTWTYSYGSPCMMYGYSHMVESRQRRGKTDCQSLANKYPFVQHLPHEKGVREILKYKDVEIANIVVPEPNYAVSETFNLSLKTGYKMPNHLIPPRRS